MDEDNEKQLEEPKIILPVKEIDEKTMNEIKKQKQKNDNRTQDELYKMPERENPEKENEINKTEEKTEIKSTIEKAKELKNTYQEMAAKIEEERRNREIRLEEMKTQEEDKTPNVKGSLLKDIACGVVVLGVLLGIGVLMTGNYLVGLGIMIVAGFGSAITLGLSEVIRLLQLIYDLLYFERYGKKRK